MPQKENFFLHFASFFACLSFGFSVTLFISQAVSGFLFSRTDYLFLLVEVISIILLSFICGFLGLAISFGKFNSKNWRINRYWFVLVVPLLTFFVLLITS